MKQVGRWSEGDFQVFPQCISSVSFSVHRGYIVQQESLLKNDTELAHSCTAGFSYDIQHVFIVIQWTMSHSSLNHNENMLYIVWKSCCTGVRKLCNISMNTAHLQNYASTGTNDPCLGNLRSVKIIIFVQKNDIIWPCELGMLACCSGVWEDVIIFFDEVTIETVHVRICVWVSTGVGTKVHLSYRVLIVFNLQFVICRIKKAIRQSTFMFI